jgi:hypothetical protein
MDFLSKLTLGRDGCFNPTAATLDLMFSVHNVWFLQNKAGHQISCSVTLAPKWALRNFERIL